jgi:(1->4)-alpha-D-glucan 1-alpha-D-glucosylmutase
MQIVSTYRLQFHKGFTFKDAAAIVPYLHDLGITHVYASPYLKAAAGSTHGYDVIDHAQLNPEVGSTADYDAFLHALSTHGMSHILDTVPNHMGVETNENHWWNDLLQHGRQSRFADYFDMNWDLFAPRTELVGKVLLPVLGEAFGQALANGKLEVKQENDRAYVYYYTRRFPANPASDSEKSLEKLLEQQHYRLSDWRVAADEINYRRFFDISGLAALQMQHQKVFDDVHQFTFRLIAEGKIDGLRVDHPDGLLDPKQYFDRLQEKYQAACPQAAAEKPLFVSVEKILNGNEELPRDWNVAGTSGYDFLCRVNDLFVDSDAEPAMTRIYQNFIAGKTCYPDWVYRNKCQVLDQAMYSEMIALTRRLDALAQKSVGSRDFTFRQLHQALREVIACFPVYRSYVSSRGVSDSDAVVVDLAIAEAQKRNPNVDPSLLNFIRDSILLRYPVPVDVKPDQLQFAQRFQQLTSPVNAKGIEDSTFYIYNRLTSLNEVGGDPGSFGRSAESLHRYFQDRQSFWPLALSSLSTHDTKRSEDLRARLNVLSEIPAEWEHAINRWRTLNADLANEIHPNDQYLLYQTLLGAWPLAEMTDSQRQTFANRICSYMQKALREAKLRSSWVNPIAQYESAVEQLIKFLIDPQTGAAFQKEFLPFKDRLATLGLYKSLSQTVLRLTAPGICDTYQGTELWDLSLVDPDNRRPVDYALRATLLKDLPDSIAKLSTDPADPQHHARLKLAVTKSLLHLRRSSPDLFLAGSYQPASLTGKFAAQCFAFAREHGEKLLIVVVPRLITPLVGTSRWDEIAWDDTRLNIPDHFKATELKNVLTLEPLSVANGQIELSKIFANFPVGVFVRVK